MFDPELQEYIRSLAPRNLLPPVPSDVATYDPQVMPEPATAPEVFAGEIDDSPGFDTRSLMRDMMKRYVSGPQLEQFPEEPQPTVKGALKEWGMGMIPMYSEMRDRRKAWEREQIRNRNVSSMAQWEGNADAIRPLLTRDLQAELDNQRVMQRAKFLEMAGVPAMEAAIYASGRTPPTPTKNDTADPVTIETPSGQRIPAYWKQDKNTGVPGYYAVGTNEPIAPEVIGRIYKTSTEGATPQERQWEHTRDMYTSRFKASRGLPPETKLTPDQEAEALLDWERAKQPPPQESWGAPVQFYDENNQPVIAQYSNRGGMREAPVPAGAKTKQAPLAATRQMADTARSLRPKMDDVIKKLQDPKYAKLLGPIAGRWNEFMLGKVGTGNPDLAYLRATIGLLQTGAMRAHVGARGGSALLSKFEGLMNAKNMDAKTLRSSLMAVRDFLKGYESQIYQDDFSDMDQPAKSQYQIGQTVNYQGKPYKIRSINPDGSLNLDPVK